MIEVDYFEGDDGNGDGDDNDDDDDGDDHKRSGHPSNDMYCNPNTSLEKVDD